MLHDVADRSLQHHRDSLSTTIITTKYIRLYEIVIYKRTASTPHDDSADICRSLTFDDDERVVIDERAVDVVDAVVVVVVRRRFCPITSRCGCTAEIRANVHK